MTRLALSLVLLTSCLPTIACAGDLFLRLEEIGYEDVDVAVDGNEPVAKVLSSLQLTIRPGEPFSAKAAFAGRKIMVCGMCKPGEKPECYDVEIRGGVHKATGEFVTSLGGVQRPIVNKTGFITRISAKVGEPLTLGGMHTFADRPDGVAGRRKSESRMILLLSTSEPEDDEA